MILDTFLSKLIGTQNERELRRIRPLVADINAFRDSHVKDIATATADIQRASTQVKIKQVILGLIALVAGVAIAAIITRSIVRPLNVAVETARRMAVGDLTMEIPRYGFDHNARRFPTDENGCFGKRLKRGVEAVKGIYQATGSAGALRDEIASWKMTAGNCQNS